MRLVCTPCILVEARLEEGVTSPTTRTPRTCSWRLIIFTGGYARKRTPLDSDPSFKDEGDGSYRPRSRTPPSESFSYDEVRVEE